MCAMMILIASLEMAIFLAATAGFASHLLYFIRGEHHMTAPILFYTYISLAATVFVYQSQISGHAYVQAGQASAIVIGAYALPLFASIVIYRVFFHRLSSFPGPFLARITKLWHVYHVRHSQNHQFLSDLHKQYGPIVRTGKSSPYDMYKLKQTMI